MLHAVYHKPALYDEILTIRTIINDIPKVKFTFMSHIFNEKGELINEGEVVLAFMNAATGRPCRVPDEFLKILKEKL